MPSVSLPSLATVSAIAGGVGAVTTAVGAISSANANAASASYSAQVARNNATIAGQNAQYASEAGAEKTAEQSMRSRAALGAMRAGIAANGVDVNSGSAADEQTGQREIGDLNTQQTAQNAALTAYGYRTQQTSFTAQSQLEEQQAGQDITGGIVSAGGDLLSGASSVGGKYSQYLQTSGGAGSSSTYEPT
jgi:hypothetical protein